MLAAPIQHLAEAHCIRVQQAQQQRPTAEQAELPFSVNSDMRMKKLTSGELLRGGPSSKASLQGQR